MGSYVQLARCDPSSEQCRCSREKRQQRLSAVISMAYSNVCVQKARSIMPCLRRTAAIFHPPQCGTVTFPEAPDVALVHAAHAGVYRHGEQACNLEHHLCA
jgi:hypothetical protein